MKTLIFQTAHFKLPDEFEGTLSDALRLLADYHDSKTGTPLQDMRCLESEIGDMSFRKANAALFEQFIDSVKDGRRFVGTIQIIEYDPGF